MLEKNGIYEAVVTDYTAEGQGIAHVEGCAVFLPNAIAGGRSAARFWCAWCATGRSFPGRRLCWSG